MDIETQFFVQSFVRFLNEQIASNGFAPDIVESLEVASQCLETAYNLPIEPSEPPAEADSATGPNGGQPLPVDPMTHVDVRQLFHTACSGHPERKREADEIKNVGNQLMREEKFEEALATYNRAISTDPTNPVFYCNRAATYSRLGVFQRAADDCYMALRYEPRYSKAYGRLGMAMSKLGHPGRAVQAYQRALELEPWNQDYASNLELAQQLYNEQQQQEAAEAAQPEAPNVGAPPPQPEAQPQPPNGNSNSFQLPANFAMPSMDTLQSVIAQPAVRNLVQSMMGDPSQVDMLRNAFLNSGAAGAGATASANGANDGNAQGAAAFAGLADLLNGGGMANIGNLLNQLNSAGGASNGRDAQHDHNAPHQP